MRLTLGCLFVIVLLCRASLAVAAQLHVDDVGEARDAKHVEFRGVAAGRFDPKLWQHGPPHFVPDLRSPLIEPRDGKFRNIYAPSIVQRGEGGGGDGWRIYYGGWDGAPSGNDRIYLADADRDFTDISNRRTVIEHGEFHHVCNVNVIPAPGGYAMACTAYPATAADNLNKPVTFFSADGEKWNAPAAGRADLITIDGYEMFATADINGMNVLLHEDGLYRLYFNNFRDFGKTFRASSEDVTAPAPPRRFRFDGIAHDKSAIVNDVKRFATNRGGGGGGGGGEKWYVMALHHNGPSLHYALGRDGTDFDAMKTLATHAGQNDRHIVSVGWVVAGDQDDPDRRLLGFLYGAGDAPSLDRNRIFARWLQKQVVIDGGDAARGRDARALGPDRQLLPLARPVTAKVSLHDEAAKLLATSDPLPLKPGRAYRLVVSAGP